MIKEGVHKDGRPFLGNDRYEGMIHDLLIRCGMGYVHVSSSQINHISYASSRQFPFFSQEKIIMRIKEECTFIYQVSEYT